MSSPPVELSVIIPSYNSRRTIRPVLKALREQENAPAHEIIMVDSSHDGTDELVRLHFPEVHLRHLPRKTFQAQARNIGAALARGHILVFLDADCRPHPDWLKQMAGSFEQPDVLAVGGQLRNANPRTAVSRAMFLLQFRESLQYGRWQAVTNMPANNVAYRRDFYLEQGGYPEQMGSSEETLFHARLRARDVALYVNPAALVDHWNLEKMGRFLRHQVKQGRFFRIACRTEDLPGSPWLKCFWLTPFFPLVRLWRIRSLLRQHVPQRWARWRTWMPLVLGFICYSWGEMKGHWHGADTSPIMSRERA
ncbi:MAG: glycosyltransferase family 2 protein [Acidobacteria bacterium]|nr:glycosyltransferase family 2 protein [Acidobacteriota bacterium]